MLATSDLSINWQPVESEECSERLTWQSAAGILSKHGGRKTPCAAMVPVSSIACARKRRAICGVKVPAGSVPSGPKPKVTASPRGEVESNWR